MRLIGEARALRDVRQAGFATLEQSPRALQAERQEVLMRSAAQRFLEGAREVRRREADLSGEHADRQPGAETRIDQLEHAPLGRGRQPSAGDGAPRLLDPRMPHQQVTERRRDRLDYGVPDGITYVRLL